MMKPPFLPRRLLPGAVLAALAAFVTARAAVAETVRDLSLEDCIQIALEHNLDIQIQRVNPRIARLTLSGS